MKLFFNLIILLIYLAPITVTSGAAEDFDTWSDITTNYQINEDWLYIGDQGIRGVVSDSDFTLLYFRPSISYRLKPWVFLNGGVRFFSAFNDEIDDLHEIGPWQGIRLVWPQKNGYEVSHYLRLEERFFWGSGDDPDFEFRSRYQLAVTTPTYDFLLKNGIYFTGSVELLWDVEDKFDDHLIDRMRFSFGAGTQISENWGVELHYMRQGEKVTGISFASDESILRLRLFYTFN